MDFFPYDGTYALQFNRAELKNYYLRVTLSTYVSLKNRIAQFS
jgi:hypothetical protein